MYAIRSYYVRELPAAAGLRGDLRCQPGAGDPDRGLAAGVQPVQARGRHGDRGLAALGRAADGAAADGLSYNFV